MLESSVLPSDPSISTAASRAKLYDLMTPNLTISVRALVDLLSPPSGWTDELIFFLLLRQHVSSGTPAAAHCALSCGLILWISLVELMLWNIHHHGR